MQSQDPLKWNIVELDHIGYVAGPCDGLNLGRK